MWKDCSTTWEKFSNLKESHLVKTDKFVAVNEIDHKQAFNWLVKHVLKKQDKIGALIKDQSDI